MPRFDIMPFVSPLGGPVEIRYAPLNASESFVGGELVFVNTDGELASFPRDDSEALIADVGAGAIQVGVAAWGPGAATSAARPNDYVRTDWRTGLAMTTGSLVGYWPADRGIQFITSITLAAGGAAAGAAPNGADRGVAFFISYGNTPTPDLGWGVEQSAATLGTQVAACIVDVLDSRKNPVTATGAGTYYVFEIKTAA